jgi:hypothetical protein
METGRSSCVLRVEEYFGMRKGATLLLGEVPWMTSHVEPTEMTNFSTDDSFGASQPLFGNITVTLNRFIILHQFRRVEKKGKEGR